MLLYIYQKNLTIFLLKTFTHVWLIYNWKTIKTRIIFKIIRDTFKNDFKLWLINIILVKCYNFIFILCNSIYHSFWSFSLVNDIKIMLTKKRHFHNSIFKIDHIFLSLKVLIFFFFNSFTFYSSNFKSKQ